MGLAFSSPACGGGAEQPRTCCGVSEAEGGPPAIKSLFSFLRTHMPVTLISIAFGLLLVTAAVWDFLDLRIPNWLVFAVTALFAVQAFRHLHEIAWLNQLGAGAICLAVGMVLFALRQLGAGDAKLFAAVALWCGLRSLLPLLLLVSVAGLIVLAVLLVVRRVLAWRGFEIDRLPKSLRAAEGVPFGVAIAAGTLITMQLFPKWLWIL